MGTSFFSRRKLTAGYGKAAKQGETTALKLLFAADGLKDMPGLSKVIKAAMVINPKKRLTAKAKGDSRPPCASIWPLHRVSAD